MKDWEVAGAYLLPRILYWKNRNNTLPGKPTKPNLRYLSLSEDNQWTVWKSSECFYPEMIPEPDYSDSGDDETASEDEGKKKSFAPDPRPALERLRDLTEVYVSNVNAKKPQRKKSPGRQAGTAPKIAFKQTPRTATKDAPQPKKSPPKPQNKKRSDSPTKVWKSSGPQFTSKKSKSPERAKETASSRSKLTANVAMVEDTFPEAKSAGLERFKVLQAEVKATRTKSTKTSTGGRTSPKPIPKTKAAATKSKTKAETVSEEDEKAAGDVKATETDADVYANTSSPESDKFSLSSDDDQLIKPRKPYVPSTEKQKLHKELKFSQKYGKLASSKTELQLALERYTENKVRRELDAEEKSSLEKILEYQAKKIEMQESMDKYPAWVERLQKPPSTWPNPKTEEFYRVHARVVSSNILTECFLPDDYEPCEGSSTSKSSLPTHSDSSSDS